MAEIDWQAEATAAANFAFAEMFEAHRGAIPWRDLGVSVAFGNDGYTQDERSQRDVVVLRDLLAGVGLVELGFGTDPEDGYTWALLVQTADHELLNELVWTAFGIARGVDGDGDPGDLFFMAYQKMLAETKVLPDAEKPRTSLN
jgi:hypothetical protein